jgi:hypothetical protein
MALAPYPAMPPGPGMPVIRDANRIGAAEIAKAMEKFAGLACFNRHFGAPAAEICRMVV